MLYQIFLSPQVKRSVIVVNKQGVYWLPDNLPNKFGLSTYTRKKKKPDNEGNIATLTSARTFCNFFIRHIA